MIRSRRRPSSPARAAAIVAAIAAAVATAGGIGCSSKPDDPPPDPDLAEVSLALLQAPSDVRCLVVTVAVDQPPPVQRRFDLGTGQSTAFVLPRLPVGRAVITLDAYGLPCAAVTAMTAPTWIGGPVTITLSPGANPPITITMRRSGQASVSADFAPGPAPMCAPVGGACLDNQDCCSARCTIPAGSLSGVGQCEAALPTGPSVQLTLDGESTHLMYAEGPMGAGCDPAGGTTYLAVVDEGDEACISPTVGEVFAIALNNVRICRAGSGCTACQNNNCRPASCFRPAPLSTTGACAVRLAGKEDGRLRTEYLLLRRIDVNNPPMRPGGLPRVINVRVNSTVTIIPPAGQTSFVFATFERPENPPPTGGGMCGGSDLCGIVPFQDTSGLPGWNLSGALGFSPLF